MSTTGPKGQERGPAGMRPEEIAQPSLHIAPAGWKLVPLEPTQQMLDALIDREQKLRYGFANVLVRAEIRAAQSSFAAVYRAMLAASPTTPTEGPTQTLTGEEIERFAVEHEAFGFGRAGDRDNVSIHGFEPEGLIAFVRAIESKVRAGTLTDPEGAS